MEVLTGFVTLGALVFVVSSMLAMGFSLTMRGFGDQILELSELVVRGGCFQETYSDAIA